MRDGVGRRNLRASYSRDPSRCSAGVSFLAFGLYLKNRNLNRNFVRVALTEGVLNLLILTSPP